MNLLHDGIAEWACWGTLVAGMLAAPLWAQPKIEITSPADGVVVHPGSSITVTVSVSPQEAFRMVMIMTQHPYEDKERSDA
jgi:hypothetical protein